ncbi:hypothetical protein M3Y94_01002200 [Aphelenchoides besseyi]|nr:hypothetical protein M3Y94_01002200 [Aphelenchoides besseyi]KAI6220403.1 hypothetical protein M3Y95_01036300 [Aphelenchoides besseyi]
MKEVVSFVFLFSIVSAQFNLGSFNLNRGPNGDLLLGFGQGGSIFGFGGDRELQVTIGPGRFGANSGGGLTLNGERVGVNSILGVDENRGLNLGSFLNGGTPRPAVSAPVSAPTDGLGGFLQSLMRAFTPPTTPQPIWTTEFTTTQSTFPTLIPDELSVGPGTDRITTEGRSGPVSSRTESEINSGEAKGKKKNRRLGPPPPEGMVEIDSIEAKKLLT